MLAVPVSGVGGQAVSGRFHITETALAYACDMKPSRYAGFKSLPTPHALTLPRLLVATSWSLCGMLLWLAVQRPWGKPGYYVFAFIGLIAGLIITGSFSGSASVVLSVPSLPTRKMLQAGPRLCLEAWHAFWIRRERDLFI